MSDNSLVRQQLSMSLESSLSGLARDAEVVMLLVDTSDSMSARVNPMKMGSPRRIDALRQVVSAIKSEGTVPMIAFGGPYDAQVRFVDNVPEPDGGTPLHLAIPFAKQYGATRVVVISDGMPDLAGQCIEEAKTFGGRIDVSFVGSVGEGGDTFLAELARLTGGTQFNGDLSDPKQLAGKIIGLLEGPREPEKAPIQGAGFAVVENDPDDDDSDDEEEDDDDDDEDKDDED